MATFFGEIQELVSRAVDLDEVEEQPVYNLTPKTTDCNLNNLECDSLIVCVGNIATAFSKCYLQSDASKLILNVIYSFESGDDDSLLYGGSSKSSKTKIAASVYYIEPGVTICEVSSDIPEVIHFELFEVIQKYIQCSSAVILTSAPIVTHKGNLAANAETPLLLSLSTSYFTPPPNFSVPRLQSPNFISGFAAAVLTEFEIKKKPAVCVINFTESNNLDSPNVQVYENLECLDSFKNIINKDVKHLLINYIKKHLTESNLYA